VFPKEKRLAEAWCRGGVQEEKEELKCCRTLIYFCFLRNLIGGTIEERRRASNY
jgi:hypothetical protein